jgi:hypothetical protein
MLIRKRCKINWNALGRSEETAEVEYFNQEDARRAKDRFDGYELEN